MGSNASNDDDDDDDDADDVSSSSDDEGRLWRAQEAREDEVDNVDGDIGFMKRSNPGVLKVVEINGQPMREMRTYTWNKPISDDTLARLKVMHPEAIITRDPIPVPHSFQKGEKRWYFTTLVPVPSQ